LQVLSQVILSRKIKNGEHIEDTLYIQIPLSLEESNIKPPSSCSITAYSVIGIILSVAGWLYWSTIFLTYWNFVSWLLFAGPMIIAPGLYLTYKMPEGTLRSSLLGRRIKLGGWFLGSISLALFLNVFVIPGQVYRHLYASQVIINPTDPLVLQLRNQFYQEVPQPVFEELSFAQQMYAVDEFILRTIQWKSDYSQFKVVGLLLTPAEVIERLAGDCQGQAAVTTSLLLSMGIKAWAVETPFHWWTHAEDNVTGQFINLNVHGHAGNQGNVLPQPIDLVFTNPPPVCSNCSEISAHNQDAILFAAPPYLAFGIAYTGAHIFVRSGLTLDQVSYIQLILYGLVLGFILALYSSYFQADSDISRFTIRLLVGTTISIGPIIFGMSFWATFLYPVTILHLAATIIFTITYLSTDTFNNVIGLPKKL